MTALRVACLFILALLTSCDSHGPGFELSGQTMGTSFSIKLVSPPGSLSLEELRAAVSDTFDAIIMMASTYVGESEISRFNAHASTDWFEVSAEFCRLVEGALSASAATGGAFDMTVAPLVNLWGFGPDSPVSAVPPARAEIDAALERVGYRQLATDCERPALRKLRPDLSIDLSGWAKGYAIDRVALLLDAEAVEDYLVEIGGELRVRGMNARGERWSIAVEEPDPAARRPHRIFRFSDIAVATSGDYRNHFEFEGTRYSHIIDPRSGMPVQHELAAVTVLADSAADADAMATALLVLGPEQGLRLAEELGVASYFLIRKGSAIEARMSSQFEREVSL